MSNSSATPDASDDVTNVLLRSPSSSRASPTCFTSTPKKSYAEWCEEAARIVASAEGYPAKGKAI